MSGAAVATEAVPAALKAVTSVLSAVAPRLSVFKIADDAISRDPRWSAPINIDPLNCNDKLPALTLAEIMRSMDAMPRRAPACTPRYCSYTDRRDRLCPPEGSRMVHALAGSKDKTLKIYDGLYHENLNEPERAAVVDDLPAWIAERTHPARTQEPALRG